MTDRQTDRQTDNINTLSKYCQTINKNNKLDYITFLQSFAVTLVIIGHCCISRNTSPNWAKIIYDTIYTFHMPLFFVLSGFLLINSFNKQSYGVSNFKIFSINKIKRLIIPYMSIGTLAYLLKVFIFNKFAYNPAELSLIFYLKSFLIPWNNPNIYLWFLPTLLIISLVCYFILKNRCSIFLLIIAFIISIFAKYTDISILNITGVLYYTFYFILGAYIFIHKEHIFQVLTNFKYIISILILYLVLLLLPNQTIILYNYIIKSVIAMCGICLSFSLALILTQKNIKFFYGLLDGKYYQIYLLSWFFQTGFRILYQIHLVNYEVVFLIMFAASIIFPLIIINIVNKYVPKLKIFIGL